MKFLPIGGRRPVGYGLSLDWVHGELALGDHKPQKLYRNSHFSILVNKRFSGGCPPEALEDMTELFDMLLQVLREYEDIIQVDEYVVVDHIVKDIVYESLENRGCMHEPEWHHAVLIVSTWGIEHYRPLITLPYLDTEQVVGIAEVQLGCPLQGGEGGADEWERIAVL